MLYESERLPASQATKQICTTTVIMNIIAITTIIANYCNNCRDVNYCHGCNYCWGFVELFCVWFWSGPGSGGFCAGPGPGESPTKQKHYFLNKTIVSLDALFIKLSKTLLSFWMFKIRNGVCLFLFQKELQMTPTISS